MAKSLWRLLMQVNHTLVMIFSVANTSFKAICEKNFRENFRIHSTSVLTWWLLFDFFSFVLSAFFSQSIAKIPYFVSKKTKHMWGCLFSSELMRGIHSCMKKILVATYFTVCHNSLFCILKKSHMRLFVLKRSDASMHNSTIKYDAALLFQSAYIVWAWYTFYIYLIIPFLSKKTKTCEVVCSQANRCVEFIASWRRFLLQLILQSFAIIPWFFLRKPYEVVCSLVNRCIYAHFDN